MQLSTEDIKKFQKIYRDIYKVELSDSSAQEEALKLVSLIKHLYKRIPVSRYKAINELSLKLQCINLNGGSHAE